jgi:hypothetical protein
VTTVEKRRPFRIDVVTVAKCFVHNIELLKATNAQSFLEEESRLIPLNIKSLQLTLSEDVHNAKHLLYMNFTMMLKP